MNHDVMHASAQVDRFILDNLQEVKETVASELRTKKYSNRVFGIYDLWNIRKKAKYASLRLRK
jgi:hypothetical protein